jgi:peroxiredoxin
MVLSGDDSTYFAKTGEVFKPINARNFLTQQNVTSANFKGKYVFIDFWGTWCKGCVEQFPQLKGIYENVNKDRIEFLGIASMDDPKRLTRFLKNRSLDWPQILSDSTNDMVAANNVTSYPSNFLIGPDGRILQRDVSISELEKVLTNLGCMK